VLKDRDKYFEMMQIHVLIIPSELSRKQDWKIPAEIC